MVEQGRAPALHISINGQAADFKTHALTLLEEMSAVAQVLDTAHHTTRYHEAIQQQLLKIEHPERTYAAKVLAELAKHNHSFFAFGAAIAKQHRDYFLSQPLSEARLALFEQQAHASLMAQKTIEDNDTLSFDDFLADYIK